MFSHVMFGVNDLEVSKKFYDALLGTLGIGPGVANKNRYFYRSPTGTSKASATRDLSELLRHGLLKVEGVGKATRHAVNVERWNRPATN